MKQTTITIRIDEDLKKQAEVLFNEMGMNLTTAYTIFTKAVVRQGKIPFEISARNPNKETLEAMKETKNISKDKIKNGLENDIYKDNNIKYYNTADEMIEDILGNEI